VFHHWSAYQRLQGARGLGSCVRYVHGLPQFGLNVSAGSTGGSTKLYRGRNVRWHSLQAIRNASTATARVAVVPQQILARSVVRKAQGTGRLRNDWRGWGCLPGFSDSFGLGSLSSGFTKREFSTKDGSIRKDSMNSGTFDVVVFTSDGSYETRTTNKAKLLRETHMNARDLILLDSGYHRRPRPVILIRPGLFIVSLSYVRAIIKSDKVYLFHPTQPKVQSFAMKFSEFLKGARAPFLPKVYLGTTKQNAIDFESEELGYYDYDNYGGATQARLAFELKALEGVLSHVCRQYYNRTLLLSPLVKNVLHTLSSRPVDPEILHQLLPMKDTLSQFEIETTLMRNVLTDLLHNEDDMLHMLLGEWESNAGEVAPERHEVVELLLENYTSQLVDIAQEAYYLRKRVESTMSIIELKLDTYRNHMLRISIQIGMLSVSLGLGTTITGYFGANLINGYENSPTAFYFLGMFSFGAIVTLYQILSRGVSTSVPRTLEGEHADSIFQHLDEIQQILAVARSRLQTGARHLSRDELKAMLRKIAGVNIDEEDLDIIYDTFDLNKDGLVGANEIDKVVNESRIEDFTKRLQKAMHS